MMCTKFDSNMGMAKFNIVSQLIIQMEEHEISQLVYSWVLDTMYTLEVVDSL